MSGIVDLTPTQSIKIYGWAKPLRILNWRVISDREDLTFKKLYNNIGLTEKQLKVLQADKTIWIREKGLTLEDITLVPSWKIHVTRDMGAKIPQIAMLNLSVEFLEYTSVTFKDLIDAGLTLNLMLILRISLIEWCRLGLYRDFLTEMTDVQSIALFQLPKNMVLQCVKETPPAVDKAAEAGMPT
jgi:DNA-binding Xre family transcriptional regulator